MKIWWSIHRWLLKSQAKRHRSFRFCFYFIFIKFFFFFSRPIFISASMRVNIFHFQCDAFRFNGHPFETVYYPKFETCYKRTNAPSKIKWSYQKFTKANVSKSDALNVIIKCFRSTCYREQHRFAAIAVLFPLFVYVFCQVCHKLSVSVL